MINIVEKSHEYLSEFHNPNIAVDMTCGRGKDTVFLAGISKHVYAFDIQSEAIVSAKDLLRQSLLDNVTVIQDNHRFVKSHVKANIDIAIYNLGYLPSGDKQIKTNPEDVIESMKQLLDLLSLNGIVVIVLYPHNQMEIAKIKDYTSSLESKFDVSHYEILNKKDCPSIIKIRRTSK